MKYLALLLLLLSCVEGTEFSRSGEATGLLIGGFSEHQVLGVAKEKLNTKASETCHKKPYKYIEPVECRARYSGPRDLEFTVECFGTFSCEDKP